MNPLFRAFVLFLLLGGAAVLRSDEFLVEYPQPALDRWMYPFNASPGVRPSAPVFGTFGDGYGVDTRHGQFLLGFETSDDIPPHHPPDRYLIQRAVVTAVLRSDQTFVFDPTADPFGSFLPTNSPAFVPDPDAGRPVELFGAGFRNEFSAESFLEDSPFGSPSPGRRNAYAAGYSIQGELVDVSNNVGKTNEAFAPFPATPFALGSVTNVAPGEPVPADTRMLFALNLADPFTVQYLRDSLASGRLRLFITSLHGSEEVTEPGQQFTPRWPDFATRDNLLYDPPTLTIEGVIVTDTDTDADGLPDDWERFYFGDLTHGGEDDPDGDGAVNRAELAAGTDPNSSESVLRIINQRSEDNTVILRFPFAASQVYRVEVGESLASWQTATGTFTYPEIGIAEWHSSDLALDSLSQAYFRIVTE